jgi:nicotinamide-nucleotide adenylyltransferase
MEELTCDCRFPSVRFLFLFLVTADHAHTLRRKGWDTLIRIFAPRYYLPPGPSLQESMTSLFATDGPTLTCARRGDVSPAEEKAFFESDEVKQWADKVEMYDLDERLQVISSTEIRKAAKEGRWEDVRRDVPFEGVVELLKREVEE